MNPSYRELTPPAAPEPVTPASLSRSRSHYHPMPFQPLVLDRLSAERHPKPYASRGLRAVRRHHESGWVWGPVSNIGLQAVCKDGLAASRVSNLRGTPGDSQGSEEDLAPNLDWRYGGQPKSPGQGPPRALRRRKRRWIASSTISATSNGPGSRLGVAAPTAA